mgnify:CR=1 FL=1
MSDTKNSQQAGRYDMLQNAAGEILIIMNTAKAVPKIRVWFMTAANRRCFTAAVKALLC